MVHSFALLPLFQVTREVIARVADLPVPGPVVGMMLLLLVLQAGLPAQGGLRDATVGVLGNHSLLFVPASVGIVQYLRRPRREGPALDLNLRRLGPEECFEGLQRMGSRLGP